MGGSCSPDLCKPYTGELKSVPYLRPSHGAPTPQILHGKPRNTELTSARRYRSAELSPTRTLSSGSEFASPHLFAALEVSTEAEVDVGAARPTGKFDRPDYRT